MIHTLQLGVGSEASLDFWAERLRARGYESPRRALAALRGLRRPRPRARHRRRRQPAAARRAPRGPGEHAITGLEGARAYGAFANVEEKLLTDTLGFTHLGGGEYRLDGEERHFHWAYDLTDQSGRQGAGTVHHIAWASRDEDHLGWQARACARPAGS